MPDTSVETKESKTNQVNFQPKQILSTAGDTNRRNLLYVSKHTAINSSTGSSTSGVSSFGSRSDFRLSNRNIKLQDSFYEETSSFLHIYRSFSFKKAIDSNSNKFSKEAFDDFSACSSSGSKHKITTSQHRNTAGIISRPKHEIRTSLEIEEAENKQNPPPPYKVLPSQPFIQSIPSTKPSVVRPSQTLSPDKMEMKLDQPTTQDHDGSPRMSCLSTLAEEDSSTVTNTEVNVRSEVQEESKTAASLKKVESILANGSTKTCLLESTPWFVRRHGNVDKHRFDLILNHFSSKRKESHKPPPTPVTISTSSDKRNPMRRPSLKDLKLIPNVRGFTFSMHFPLNDD